MLASCGARRGPGYSAEMRGLSVADTSQLVYMQP